MRLTDLSIKALPFVDTQRDYPDAAVRGLAIRVGKQTKTFMVLIRKGEHRSRVKIGAYPKWTLSKARERARDLLAEARISKTEPHTIRVEEALETFYRIHGPSQRPGSHTECRRLLDKHLRQTLGHLRLTDLKATQIAPILDELSLGNRRNTYVYLRSFLNWSYQRGYIDVSPIARLKPPPPSVPRERVLTDDELVRVWHACPAFDYGLVVKLCILSGQRIGQWVRFKPDYVHGDMIVWPADAMKGGKTHTLPLTPMIAALISRRTAMTGKMPATQYKSRLDRRSGVIGYCHHDIRRTVATKMASLRQHIRRSTSE
jgi:integrase